MNENRFSASDLPGNMKLSDFLDTVSKANAKIPAPDAPLTPEQMEAMQASQNPAPNSVDGSATMPSVTSLLQAAKNNAVPASASGAAPLTPEQLASLQTPPQNNSPENNTPAPTSNKTPAAKKEISDEDLTSAFNPPTAPTAPAANPLEDTEMKNAMELSGKNRQISNWNSLMADLSNGIIGQGGANLGQNRIGALDAAINNANQPVTDLKAQRDQYTEFLNNKDLREKNDPNSSVSKTMREALAGMGVKIPDNATYAGMEKLAPQLMKNKEFQMKIQEMGLKREELGQNRQAMANQKATTQQNAAATKTQQLLEQMRGAPAVQQAEKDLYAASKVNSMVNLKADPNQLDNQQVQLLASEVGKIATGGVPTTHELQGLNVSTMPSTVAKYAQMFTNKPSPANKGAFIKAMQDYTNSLQEDAKKVITDRYGRILDSNKKHLNPDDYDTLSTQYVHRFDQSNPVKATASKGSVSSATLQDYATKHNIDVGAAADLLSKAGYDVQK